MKMTSFAALNCVQFLTALNDNIYKLLLIFLLINIKGVEHSNIILSIAGGVFVIPFLLFASTAGTLADRFSKRTIITFTRFFEILVVSGGVLFFSLQSVIGGYVILFLMATQSAIFSPCKYGILPEIVKKEKLSHYNGLMTATTYLAIIIGTFLASFLADVTHKNFVLSAIVCVCISIAGAFFSLKIEKTPPQAAHKAISFRFFTEIVTTLKRASKVRYLLAVIIFGAYFLFLGAYVQLNIIPFAIQSLARSEIQGGYLFLMTAIGIGIGSYLCGRISGKEIEIGFVPLAATGLSFVLIGLLLFDSHFYVVLTLLLLLGILGGFYIVPIDAFIQVASPSTDRGQNVAASNFLNFCGVITAAALIALLGSFLQLSAALGFFIVGVMSLLMAITLFFLLLDQVLRLFVAYAASIFWKMRVSGKKNVHFTPGVLLVAERKSWLDTIIVMATLPRLIRYVVPLNGRFVHTRRWLYKLLALIPQKTFQETLNEIKHELSLGHSVCLMMPAHGEMEGVVDLLAKTGVPLVPIHITRKKLPAGSTSFEQIVSLFKYPIKVSFG